jgi:hypothetical protein
MPSSAGSSCLPGACAGTAASRLVRLAGNSAQKITVRVTTLLDVSGKLKLCVSSVAHC